MPLYIVQFAIAFGFAVLGLLGFTGSETSLHWVGVFHLTVCLVFVGLGLYSMSREDSR